jgi:hypothetical protein
MVTSLILLALPTKGLEAIGELPSSEHSPRQAIFKALLDYVSDAFLGTCMYAKPSYQKKWSLSENCHPWNLPGYRDGP